MVTVGMDAYRDRTVLCVLGLRPYLSHVHWSTQDMGVLMPQASCIGLLRVPPTHDMYIVSLGSSPV